MVLPQTTQTAAILDRTAVKFTQLAMFTLQDRSTWLLMHSAGALAAAGRNNY